MVGPFTATIFNGPILGSTNQQAGQGVGADTGPAAVEVPAIVYGYGGSLSLKFGNLGSVGIVGLSAAMEEGDRVGDAGDEGAGRKAISADIDAAAARAGKVLIEAISLVKSQR